MKTRKHTRRGPLLLAAVAAVALMGGSAFTASTTMPTETQQVGYGTVQTTGGSVTSVDYGLSTDGANIESVTITFTDNYSSAEVTASLDDTPGVCGEISGGENSTECTFSDVSTGSLETTKIAIDGTVSTT